MKTAILLFNLGGPDTPKSVKPFLFNLFYDPAIINIFNPFRWILAKIISSRRDPIAQEIYNYIGGGSPLLSNTIQQAHSLTKLLNNTSKNLGEVKCFPVMRYWHPFAQEIAQEVKMWAPDKEILLPLYPQFSTATTQSSIKDWMRARRSFKLNSEIQTICCYPENTGFIKASADLLKKSLIKVRKKTGENPCVFFSAHGLPKKVIDKGDPYQWQIEKSATAIVKILNDKNLDWKVTYQSRVGPLEWVKPYTEEEIKKAGENKKPLIIVPIAFVSEHSETLVELDIEYRELAEETGVPFYERVPTVSTHPYFIQGLANIIKNFENTDYTFTNETGLRLCPNKCRKCPVKNMN